MHSRLGHRLRWLFVSVAALLAIGVAAVALGPRAWLVQHHRPQPGHGHHEHVGHQGGPQSVSLGYVSGTLNNLAQHLALAVKGAPVLHPTGRGILMRGGLPCWHMDRLRHRSIARRARRPACVKLASHPDLGAAAAFRPDALWTQAPCSLVPRRLGSPCGSLVPPHPDLAGSRIPGARRQARARRH